MQIEYDKKADTKYIRIKNGKIAQTKKKFDWLLFDCANNGEVLGIEILDASLNLVSIITSNDELIGFSIVKSKPAGLIIDSNVENGEGSWELNIKSPEYSRNRLFALA